MLADQLQPGWQTGVITFNASADDGFAATLPVTVRAYLGPVDRVFLPLLNR